LPNAWVKCNRPACVLAKVAAEVIGELEEYHGPFHAAEGRLRVPGGGRFWRRHDGSDCNCPSRVTAGAVRKDVRAGLPIDSGQGLLPILLVGWRGGIVRRIAAYAFSRDCRKP